jgi:FKBP-type peptidyl-prolyl cis-trans isomerase (trigger factor)
LKTLGKDKETYIQEDVKPIAKRRLERALVIESLAKAENLRIDPQELQQETIASLQIYQGDPEFRKLKGQQMENLIRNLSNEAAVRLLNRSVMDRLKTIASGQAVSPAEPVTTDFVEPAVEIVTAQPAVEETAPQVEAAEEPQTPADEKPADA